MAKGGGGEPLERGKCRGQPRDEPGGGIKLRLAQAGARVGGVQIGGFPAPELRELGAERRERVREPAVPGRGRGPRSTAFSSAATAARVRAGRGAEPRERMLEQGEQRDRRKPAESRVRRQPREQPGRRVGERIAAGIIHRDVPALQGREHAARQRAVGRDRALRSYAASPSASRRLMAMASASSSALAASIDRQCVERAFNPGSVASGEPLPALGDGGRPQRLGNVQRSRPCAAGLPN